MERKPEHFHPIPSVRRAREKNAASISTDKVGAQDGKPGRGEHGPVHRTEVESSGDGKFRVKAHHGDGHVETHDGHASHHEAHEFAKSLHEGDEQRGMAPEEMNADDTEHMQTESDTGGAEECPNCGSDMKDGKCPQCGYQEHEEGEEEAE